MPSQTPSFVTSQNILYIVLRCIMNAAKLFVNIFEPQGDAVRPLGIGMQSDRGNTRQHQNRLL